MTKKDTSQTKEAVDEIYNRGVVGVYRGKRQIFVANLIGGMAWGLGAVLGATLLVTFSLLLLNWLGGLPVIGYFFYDLAKTISEGPAAR